MPATTTIKLLHIKPFDKMNWKNVIASCIAGNLSFLHSDIKQSERNKWSLKIGFSTH